MNKAIILILLSMIVQICQGQETDLDIFENNYLQIRQKPGTDNLLRKYIAHAGCKEDTVYAFMYTPGLCPRCEGMLKTFRSELLNNNRKLLLISICPDDKVAKMYNKSKGYKAEYYIYDTGKACLNIFSFNRSALHGAYILKMTKKGRLISGGDDNLMSSKFVQLLIAGQTPLPYKNFEKDIQKGDEFIPAYPLTAPTLKRASDLTMNMPDSIWLCKVTGPLYWDDDYFLVADDILNVTEVFHNNHNVMQFEKLLQPTHKEKMQFVHISQKDYDVRQKNGMFFNMICSVNKLDKNHYGMSYSLPDLKYEGDGFAYYNEPCILTRTKDCFKPDSTIIFDFEVDTSRYFFQHFTFSAIGSKLFIGCQKLTWPMEYEPAEYKGYVFLNPFKEEFYFTENPFMAVFDRNSGKLITQFGHLDNIAKKTRTGYAFVTPLSNVYRAEIAYTDSWSGKVYVTDTANVHKEKACYEVFRIRESDLPPIDSTKFYTNDYLMPFNRAFCRKIQDLRIMPDYVYCIVNYGNFYKQRGAECDASFIRVNRKTGKVEEWSFPREYGAYTLFARGLRSIKNRILPFVILKKNGKARLRTYNVQDY